MKQHIVVIRGGDVFDTNEGYLNFLREYKIESLDYFVARKKWQDTLQSELGDGYLIIKPTMPNRYSAQYIAWKIWFEKLVPFLNDNVILIGSSLGGFFLSKYLAENDLPVHVSKLFLIAPPYSMADAGYDQRDFTPPTDFSKVAKQCDQIYLYHSQDDDIVPVADQARFAEVLPDAIVRSFTDKGHFYRELELPEIIADILDK